MLIKKRSTLNQEHQPLVAYVIVLYFYFYFFLTKSKYHMLDTQQSSIKTVPLAFRWSYLCQDLLYLREKLIEPRVCRRLCPTVACNLCGSPCNLFKNLHKL